MKEDVFGLSERVINRGVSFFNAFRRCVDASAKSIELEAPSSNNLPTQTNDVMGNPINPVNPDSKP
jgi:hypothetical protein